jgi:hypothetical protein
LFFDPFRALKLCRVTGNSITLEEVLSSESVPRPVEGQPEQHGQATGEEARILKFAELKALIEQGTTDCIPNNKVIPNVLNVSTFDFF